MKTKICPECNETNGRHAEWCSFGRCWLPEWLKRWLWLVLPFALSALMVSSSPAKDKSAGWWMREGLTIANSGNFIKKTKASNEPTNSNFASFTRDQSFLSWWQQLRAIDHSIADGDEENYLSQFVDGETPESTMAQADGENNADDEVTAAENEETKQTMTVNDSATITITITIKVEKR